LLNIGGNLLLIPRFGGMGAAWVAVGAWSFGAFGAPWCFAATRELIRKMAASAPPVSGAGK
jgi:O-antigen/teichoic acid export membrane protein